ncbi:hypothetical protein CDAR_508681 [Caerostris darwini]|uniref:Uncharacterized protein n=1 Tax=Caerostris darwini TaxID=1538125 RepID=A0AAV4N3A1_9ARAC|nr:hypothetical protein CDAR_508681 [Caerostris darwini]
MRQLNNNLNSYERKPTDSHNLNYHLALLTEKAFAIAFDVWEVIRLSPVPVQEGRIERINKCPLYNSKK